MHKTLIFDLDNTLYPASCNLFDQVDVKMAQYVANLLNISVDEANVLQKKYFHQYGTTLSGLMKHHNVPPEDFLDFVHDIDTSVIPHNAPLVTALEKHQGEKYIYTNGSTPHANNILKHLCINHCFNGIFDIVASDYRPKPALAPFEEFLTRYNINPHHAIMIDDIPRNLEPAAKLGITTVWIESDTEYAQMQSEHGTPANDYIHHTTSDIAAWLHTYLEPADKKRIVL